MPDGVVAVTVFAFTTLTLVAATPPIMTLDVPERFVPVIVIGVPPLSGPVLGDTPVTVGAATYVKPLARLAVPAAVVSETVREPTEPGGVLAVTTESLTTVIDVASASPTLTDVVPASAVPVIVIKVPPDAGPAFGAIDMMVGPTHGGD